MKRIALINDLSGFGKCSLTAAIPVISAMGMQACPLPTAILSAQTGFEHFFYDDYTDRMNEITDHWKQMQASFDGIYSGYLGSSRQIQNVLFFLDQFKNERNFFLADPVMGDNGRRIKIFTPELLQTMKELTRKADVITPNLTEACLLADADYEGLMVHQKDDSFLEWIYDIACEIRDKAETAQTVVVTGIIRRRNEKSMIGNLILSGTDRAYLESSYTQKSFSGTGDLFASVVIGALVKGETITDAVRRAMSFLQPAIEEASLLGIPGNDGVMFEKYLSKLIG